MVGNHVPDASSSSAVGFGVGNLVGLGVRGAVGFGVGSFVGDVVNKTTLAVGCEVGSCVV
jgi:hypothetical protein